ncbi:MAG TPA: CocE/NonD family hydrolase C-terminal non-catalytic domain-containing protein, partial [Methylomirabilota bacterium]|nr:CocE/NonD family hydrolase C-terminal non-catalytic domain-containing protein [Methylomirabilota bacterium]
PVHPHARAERLEPGRIYEFQIPLVPTANLFKAGSKIKLRISCSDDKASHSLEGVGIGHIRRQLASRVTVYHNEEFPSHLLLPITDGNIIGTYISGGEPYV